MTNLELIQTAPADKLAKILDALGAEDVIDDETCKRCPHTVTCDEAGTCVYKHEAIISVWLRQEATL